MKLLPGNHESPPTFTPLPASVGDQRRLSGRFVWQASAPADIERIEVWLDVDGPEALGVASLALSREGALVHRVVELNALGSNTWAGQVSLPLEPPAAGPLLVQLNSLGGGKALHMRLGELEVELARESKDFRDLVVVVTQEQGIDLVDEAVLNTGQLTLVKGLARAGIRARLTNPTSITEAEAGGAAPDTADQWDDIELHDAMLLRWEGMQKPGFRVWVLAAGQHEEGMGLAGLMFDGMESPDSLQRQGLAVFANAHLHQFGSEAERPLAMRNRLFTLIHELGHALNLGHSWEKTALPDNVPGAGGWVDDQNRPGAASWMNYPHRVEGFWESFRGTFDGPELLFLRHAPARMVMMGGEPFYVNHALLMAAEPSGLSAQVEGRTRFEAYEPVRIFVVLRNDGDQPLRLPAGIERSDEGLEVWLWESMEEQARGRRLRAFTHSLRDDEGPELRPGEALGLSRYIGGEPRTGAVFSGPGTWAVSVRVVGHDRTLAWSPRVELHVAEPEISLSSEQEEAWRSDLVCRMYRFGGSSLLSSPGLPAGIGPQVGPASRLRSQLQVLSFLQRNAAEGTATRQAVQEVKVGALSRSRRLLRGNQIRRVEADPGAVDAMLQGLLDSPLAENPAHVRDLYERHGRALSEPRREDLSEGLTRRLTGLPDLSVWLSRMGRLLGN